MNASRSGLESSSASEDASTMCAIFFGVAVSSPRPGSDLGICASSRTHPTSRPSSNIGITSVCLSVEIDGTPALRNTVLVSTNRQMNALSWSGMIGPAESSAVVRALASPLRTLRIASTIRSSIGLPPRCERSSRRSVPLAAGGGSGSGSGSGLVRASSSMVVSDIGSSSWWRSSVTALG
jgi:hypothetical protein